jgi:GT2 family glycosyltransferase
MNSQFTDIIQGPSMNPVLMLCRNSLELTKNAIRTVLEQDIPVALYVIDNDSTDGTAEFILENRIKGWRMTPAKGVSASWNFGLDYFFNTAMCRQVLVINNDVELRPDTYKELIFDGGPFVTAVSVGDPKQLEWDGRIRKRPHPDFSCFLIRKQVWQKVGPFDESMLLYASDGDYHLRMHNAGIEACTIGIPFYHYASGTLKNATEEERRAIEKQANADRDTFHKKWGVSIGSVEYYALFESSTP